MAEQLFTEAEGDRELSEAPRRREGAEVGKFQALGLEGKEGAGCAVRPPQRSGHGQGLRAVCAPVPVCGLPPPAPAES